MKAKRYRESWTEEDWLVEFDERVGIKMDSGIEEKEAEIQARAGLKPLYQRWKAGQAPTTTRRGRAPRREA